MEDEEYKHARERAQSLRGFYTNLISFAVVNLILFAINAITSPGNWWFYWVTIFWGIGLIFHALNVFSMSGDAGREWEDRKTREIMDKDQERKKKAS